MRSIYADLVARPPAMRGSTIGPRHGPWLCALSLTLMLSTLPDVAAWSAEPDSKVCTLGPDDDEEEAKSARFRFAGSCLQISGSTQFIGQSSTLAEPRVGNFPTARRYGSNTSGIRVDLARETSAGWFMLAFETSYGGNTDSGMDELPSLDEASASFLGVSVGYSSSLMGFWEGAFQFKASAPSLSTYLVAKEVSLSEKTKLAIAVEAGPPASKGASTWQLPDDPPYVTARLKYDKDDWALQVSAAARQIEVSPLPLVQALAEDKVGWAVTTGAKVPLAYLSEGDSVSVVLTYAVDSRVFLGTPNDAAALAAIFPGAVPLPSRGRSALVSFEHNWSEVWSSNVFASFVELELAHAFGTPRFRTSRYAANLIFAPTESWEFGIEAGFLDTKIDLDGVLGVATTGSLTGRSAFVWVKRTF